MKNLRRILGQNEMTQKELAEKTGISLATINRYVRQQGNPSMDHLVKVSEALDCGLDELVYGDKASRDYEVIRRKLETGEELTSIERHDLLHLEHHLHGVYEREYEEQLAIQDAELKQWIGDRKYYLLRTFDALSEQSRQKVELLLYKLHAMESNSASKRRKSKRQEGYRPTVAPNEEEDKE